MSSGAPLTLYNSLSRSLERFEPIDPANVRVYSCGPTVYNYAHIGNLRAYVFTDTLSRVLTWKGYPLTHVINITDVGHLTSDADAGDDKMEAAAKASARSIWDIAKHYTEAFWQNLKDLNIREPSRWSIATDHIAEMIAFGERIAEKHCYQLESGLYFDVSTVPDYGKLAGNQDDVREGRIETVEGKRHPQDFAIWRASPPGEQRQMEWDSPWGKGAPGWHLECSVMSEKYLGSPFDIHTGGIDHREIHHPNEIAQNQAFCDCSDTGARWWMHNNFLVERAGKMSKSSGEFRTLQTLIDAGVHPLAYRLMCLQAHYRSELEFSEDNLLAAFTRLKRLVIAKEIVRKRAYNWKEVTETLPESEVMRTIRIARSMLLGRYLDDLEYAVSDDLNTPRALVILESALKDKALSWSDKARFIVACDSALGLKLAQLRRESLRIRPALGKGQYTLMNREVDALVVARRVLKGKREFAASDVVRDVLTKDGVELMDGDPLGWDWKPVL